MSSASHDKSLEFEYDYLGRRVEKKVWSNAGYSGSPDTHLRFAYNGMELVAELEGSSQALLKTFHWGVDKSDTRGGAGGAMGLLFWRDHLTDESYYPSYDLNGNVTGLLDDSGSYVAWYEYDAFGKVETRGGTGGMEESNPIRFSTQFTDEETGLVYYGLRYYDPSKGRFVKRDPIGEQGGLNLYRFVRNDPVSFVDVWGLTDEEVFELAPMVVKADPPLQTFVLGPFISKASANPPIYRNTDAYRSYLMDLLSQYGGDRGTEYFGYERIPDLASLIRENSDKTAKKAKELPPCSEFFKDGKFNVTTQSFIMDEKITNLARHGLKAGPMGGGAQLVPTEDLAGDGRGFLESPADGINNTYRGSNSLTVYTNDGYSVHDADYGLSIRYSKRTGAVVGTARADSGRHWANAWGRGSQVRAELVSSAGEPFDSMITDVVAPIYIRAGLTFDSSTGIVSGSVTHTQFPSFQVFVIGQNIYNSQQADLPAKIMLQRRKQAIEQKLCDPSK